ncbi:MAG: hypothetical protein WC594_11670 [Thermodesulfovibrionales bacterium]
MRFKVARGCGKFLYPTCSIKNEPSNSVTKMTLIVIRAFNFLLRTLSVIWKRRVKVEVKV